MHSSTERTLRCREMPTCQRLRSKLTDVGFRLINNGFLIEWAVQGVGRIVGYLPRTETQHTKISKKNVLAILQCREVTVTCLLSLTFYKVGNRFFFSHVQKNFI
jgi:hypothetical protein